MPETCLKHDVLSKFEAVSFQAVERLKTCLTFALKKTGTKTVIQARLPVSKKVVQARFQACTDPAFYVIFSPYLGSSALMASFLSA